MTLHMKESTPWRIRLANLEDAHLLAELASRTFWEAFGRYNSVEDMSMCVSEYFSRERQATELADPRSTFFLAEVEKGPAGYAKLREGAAPAVVTGSKPVQLHRLYVDRAWQGTGMAAELMTTVLEEARRRGAQTMWLCVWERNDRALSFYRRWGFEDVGSQVFVLGTDPQTDRVMTRPIENTNRCPT
jgi:GNAT superfamily N-acetyltransferase